MVGKMLNFVEMIGPVGANACCELLHHIENPGEAQWNAVKDCLDTFQWVFSSEAENETTSNNESSRHCG